MSTSTFFWQLGIVFGWRTWLAHLVGQQLDGVMENLLIFAEYHLVDPLKGRLGYANSPQEEKVRSPDLVLQCNAQISSESILEPSGICE